MTKTKKAATKKHILCNKSYGIYYGEIIKINLVTGIAEVRDCRHVCYWYGGSGGITSLAAHGLCGPRAGESRVGAPCNATLSGIVNVFECSAKAAATLDAEVVL